MKKILIVEDQMLARKYLCSCIEKSTECEVASALTRADAALQRCGEGHIDLVVMDICTENRRCRKISGSSKRNAGPERSIERCGWRSDHDFAGRCGSMAS